MESVPDGSVRWGMRLKSVESDMSLHFENGVVERGFDLIVGADGAFSKTRQFLSSEKPFYTGLGGYAMAIPDAAERAPDVNKLVDRGSVFSFGDYKTLNGQQLGSGNIDVSYYAHFDEDFTKKCGFDVTDVNAVKDHLRKELHDWSPELKTIFERCSRGM
ncbi:hypothetical protein K458DRAFT_60586 [Lentithecium fluviatile CBS 122367]|uniref:FAD-binding domain-containing protein n=1 Tax=Lentithecium fluviatile CBS 122367 TaxID=1168545 RepID=A0A6G1IWD0_9PLEO|nr:hypothetical protein K458DRAFT_60586 [Lentithecium fluviatile CBS 122367]